jgi:hypothetical protein
MSLRSRFAELYATAELQGEASAELAGGAALTVTIRGGRRQVVISRTMVPVGLVETDTFMAHGHIPDDAVGVCWFWNKRHGYRVSFTWEITPPPASLFDLAPAADVVSPQLASGEAKAPASSHVTQLLVEGERLPEGL